MSRMQSLTAAVVLAAGLLPAFAQNTTPTPTFRVSVDRIQIGAVVTDSKGNHITNLGIGDFTVMDGGKRQQLTNCEYLRSANPVRAVQANAASVQPAVGRGLTSAPNAGAGGQPLTRESTGRSIVYLIDDLSYLPTTIPAVRQAVENAIQHNLQPTDMAALVRTSSGNSSLEQFTSDRRVLLAAVKKISWRSEGRGIPGILHLAGPFANDWKVELTKIDRTVEVVQYVISALRELPGRKAIFLISQSLPIGGTYASPQTGVAQMLGVLVDRALRAGVVIYSVDPTPLAPVTVDASYDETGDILSMTGGSPSGAASAANARQLEQKVQGYPMAQLVRLEFLRAGLRLLSEGTGGQMAADTDLTNALARFARDLQGYYLLTYRPTSAHRYFGAKRDGTPFRSVRVQVAKAGMHVRSYAGYMALEDAAEPDPSAQVRTMGLGPDVGKALFSPFPASGVHVGLISTFTATETASPALSLMVHIDARDVSFSEQNGRHDAHLDLVARAGSEWNEAGEVVSKEVVLHLKDDTFAEAMAAGLQYPVAIEPPHPGLYDIRVAVRDRASGRIGSARNFVEVPNLLDGKPALTGPVLSDGGRQTDQFGTATSIHFECRLFSSPSVNAEVRIVRDGRQVLALAVPIVSGAIQGAIPAASLPVGRYSLQVVANGAKPAATAASQWADFEIAP